MRRFEKEISMACTKKAKYMLEGNVSMTIGNFLNAYFQEYRCPKGAFGILKTHSIILNVQIVSKNIHISQHISLFGFIKGICTSNNMVWRAIWD